MKILLTFDDRVRHDSTGIYFRDAFRYLGDVVWEYNENLGNIDYRAFDLAVKIDDGLDSHKFPRMDGIPTAYYVIDTHIDDSWRIKLAEEANFTHIFCAQKQATNAKWHTENVHWLPLGCDPNRHAVLAHRHKKYDVGFIGNAQPAWQKRRCERLDKLFEAFPNFFYGQRFFKDMAEAFAECKIVFNSAHSTDINMRVFEALASGSMLLTDKQEWHGLFKPDVHFVEYDSDEDMLRKARYYIDNDMEREQIAQCGQQEVLNNHTYLHRCKEIVKCTQK